MEPLYFAKYINANESGKEHVRINCILDEWEYGFRIDCYTIEKGFVYFEDASWNGKKLDYSTLGKPIKRNKYEFVKNTIAKYRSELEFLGKSGEKMHSPEFKGGNYYFLLAEDEDDEIPERYAAFYHVISIDDNNITFVEHSLDEHYIGLRRGVNKVVFEDFLLVPDDAVWYEISVESYCMAGNKIVQLTEQLLSKFREK